MDTKSISKLTAELMIFCIVETWIKIGKSKLQLMETQYKVADGNPLQVLGQFKVTAELDGKAGSIDRKVVGYQCGSTEPTWETSPGVARTR